MTDGSIIRPNRDLRRTADEELLTLSSDINAICTEGHTSHSGQFFLLLPGSSICHGMLSGINPAVASCPASLPPASQFFIRSMISRQSHLKKHCENHCESIRALFTVVNNHACQCPGRLFGPVTSIDSQASKFDPLLCP